MSWCGKAARLQVRTNADNPEQTENAIAFGAQGIGLTRTEHMFFEGDRIDAVTARERVKFAELAPLYGSTPAEAVALTREQFAELSALAALLEFVAAHPFRHQANDGLRRRPEFRRAGVLDADRARPGP